MVSNEIMEKAETAGLLAAWRVLEESGVVYGEHKVHVQLDIWED